jgi:hypothetical protein
MEASFKKEKSKFYNETMEKRDKQYEDYFNKKKKTIDDLLKYKLAP